MLRLEKVTGKNVWDILKLEVLDDQKYFVAGNDTSIIEAYIAITGNGHAFPFGIYERDMPDGIELCIGGPRASEYSRAYDTAREILFAVFTLFWSERWKTIVILH